ncbi:unnamed protein product [Trichogramma brassicae]|uniref:Uncharacterized protein n=1 Tax=Trichogramma brassicae TaxID=86971 RepID=A0A6H5IVZ7_9HYME|nr:unnamed protein product [Trichogramma brassicae]CAB0041055.1 unnamed protein product [Trichogramma brassicae]CAB0041058.1 unnamed protein product [Trichogramma brassicae]
MKYNFIESPLYSSFTPSRSSHTHNHTWDTRAASSYEGRRETRGNISTLYSRCLARGPRPHGWTTSSPGSRRTLLSSGPTPALARTLRAVSTHSPGRVAESATAHRSLTTKLLLVFLSTQESTNSASSALIDEAELVDSCVDRKTRSSFVVRDLWAVADSATRPGECVLTARRVRARAGVYNRQAPRGSDDKVRYLAESLLLNVNAQEPSPYQATTPPIRPVPFTSAANRRDPRRAAFCVTPATRWSTRVVSDLVRGSVSTELIYSPAFRADPRTTTQLACPRCDCECESFGSE